MKRYSFLAILMALLMLCSAFLTSCDMDFGGVSDSDDNDEEGRSSEETMPEIPDDPAEALIFAMNRTSGLDSYKALYKFGMPTQNYVVVIDIVAEDQNRKASKSFTSAAAYEKYPGDPLDDITTNYVVGDTYYIAEDENTYKFDINNLKGQTISNIFTYNDCLAINGAFVVSNMLDNNLKADMLKDIEMLTSADDGTLSISFKLDDDVATELYPLYGEYDVSENTQVCGFEATVIINTKGYITSFIYNEAIATDGNKIKASLTFDEPGKEYEVTPPKGYKDYEEYGFNPEQSADRVLSDFHWAVLDTSRLDGVEANISIHSNHENTYMNIKAKIDSPTDRDTVCYTRVDDFSIEDGRALIFYINGTNYFIDDGKETEQGNMRGHGEDNSALLAKYINYNGYAIFKTFINTSWLGGGDMPDNFSFGVNADGSVSVSFDVDDNMAEEAYRVIYENYDNLEIEAYEINNARIMATFNSDGLITEFVCELDKYVGKNEADHLIYEISFVDSGKDVDVKAPSGYVSDDVNDDVKDDFKVDEDIKDIYSPGASGNATLGGSTAATSGKLNIYTK